MWNFQPYVFHAQIITLLIPPPLHIHEPTHKARNISQERGEKLLRRAFMRNSSEKHKYVNVKYYARRKEILISKLIAASGKARKFAIIWVLFFWFPCSHSLSLSLAIRILQNAIIYEKRYLLKQNFNEMLCVYLKHVFFLFLFYFISLHPTVITSSPSRKTLILN